MLQGESTSTPLKRRGPPLGEPLKLAQCDMQQAHAILKQWYIRPKLPERLAPVSQGDPHGRLDSKKCVWPYTFTAPIVMSGSRRCARSVSTVGRACLLVYCMRSLLLLASRLCRHQAPLPVRYHLTCLLHPPCPRPLL